LGRSAAEGARDGGGLGALAVTLAPLLVDELGEDRARGRLGDGGLGLGAVLQRRAPAAELKVDDVLALADLAQVDDVDLVGGAFAQAERDAADQLHRRASL